MPRLKSRGKPTKTENQAHNSAYCQFALVLCVSAKVILALSQFDNLCGDASGGKEILEGVPASRLCLDAVKSAGKDVDEQHGAAGQACYLEGHWAKEQHRVVLHHPDTPAHKDPWSGAEPVAISEIKL